MRWPARIDKWLRVSVRRHLLDEELQKLDEFFLGRVLEIGTGKVGRRGEFSPPIQTSNIYLTLDSNFTVSPHVCADINNIPNAHAAFDTVFCLEVLEYQWSPRKALKEINRILKPGGTLILSVPFLHRVDSDRDYWRLSDKGLHRMLKETGFNISWMKSQGGAWAVAVNIMKYTINVISNERIRLWIGLIVRPLLNALWAYDRKSTKSNPVLATFSTGYLVLATSEPQGDQ